MIERMDYLEAVDSTNDYLRAFAGEGVSRAAVAGTQRAGKGRHGRSWDSPPGRGLYASYLLYPGWPQDRSPFLNQIAALALKKALSRLDPDLSRRLFLKAPNDVLLDERKLAGILVELGSLGDRITWVIIGVGVNLSQTRFQLDRTHLEPTSLALQGFAVPHPLDLYVLLTRELEGYFNLAGTGRWSNIRSEFESEVERRGPLGREG